MEYSKQSLVPINFNGELGRIEDEVVYRRDILPTLLKPLTVEDEVS